MAQAFSTFLTAAADGTSYEANTDGSSVPVLHDLAGHATHHTYIQELTIYIEDTVVVDVDLYGAVAILTNGVEVETVSDGVTTDLLDGLDIKNLGDWIRRAGDYTMSPTGGTNDGVTITWKFRYPLILAPGTANVLRVTINDLMTGLTSHTFHAQGFTSSRMPIRDDFRG